MKPSTIVLSALAATLAYAAMRGRRPAIRLGQAAGAAAFEAAAGATNPGEAVGRMGLAADVQPVSQDGADTIRPGLGDFLRGA